MRSATDGRRGPRVVAVPATAPFLPTLVEGLLDGRVIPGVAFSRDPLSLATLTLYLPSRRAVRAARDAFLDAFGGRAALLPRMRAIADADEDELAFGEEGEGALGLELPAAIDPLERQLALMRRITAWSRDLNRALRAKPDEDFAIPCSPADAARLAAELARLMDAVATEGADWTRLKELLPDELARYWQVTRDFLRLATETWPGELAARGALDPSERLNRLMRAEAERLARAGAPVVAAGLTGAMPATAALLAAIAALPQGAVALTGLDGSLDEGSWTALDGIGGPDSEDAVRAHNHPQHGLRRLLKTLGVERRDVERIEPRAMSPAARCREALLSETLRPASTTNLWRSLHERVPDRSLDGALEHVALVEAHGEQEEALAIALALREAVERDGATAALVTPDRGLARRVAVELARWELQVDDSAGVPLSATPPAVFCRLVVEAVAARFAPTPLLALLKHPFASFGLGAREARRGARALERACLRGLRPGPGLDGLGSALARALGQEAPSRGSVAAADATRAETLVRRLRSTLGELEETFSAATPLPLKDLARLHLEACRRAAASPEDEAFLAGEAGEALADFFVGLLEARGADVAVAPQDYLGLLVALMGERAVRPRAPSHPRLAIWGLLEARLQSVDRIILGGLNEGVWPPQTQNDPWLSRPMRSGVGLSPPERRVGLAAQDFCGAFASKEVLLVRASRVGGAPTVASRWLQRLTALVGEERTRTLRRRGEHYLDWARRIDQPPAMSPCARPDPKPPVAARPRRLSITEIEHWVRDPYTIYARHVLRLEPLDPLDAEPGGAERGTLIHEALNRFARKTREAWPEDAASLLLAEGRALFEAYRDYPAFTAYWWPRFERIAAWFCGFEPARRDGCAALHVEIQGEIAFDAPAGPFTLRGRADRIDLRADGTLAILDYKTGRPASPKEVRAGLAPQLALEAAMARRGAFDPAFKDRSVGELAFVRLSGGEPAGEHKPCTWDRQGVTIDDVAEEAWQRLTELVARFDDPEQGYLAMPHPQFRLAYGAYDHLARVREWSETGGVELDR